MRTRWGTNLWWKKTRAVDRFRPIPTAAVIAALLVLLLWILSGWYGGAPGEILRGFYIEAGGAVMDIVVFGIVIAWLAYRRDQDQEITRQMELIDDYKKWDSDEARYRIAGAIRRLNKLNRTDIDFSGIEMSEFRFRWLEIESIRGSTFYDGSLGSDRSILTNVDFSEVDCRDVVFSKISPLPIIQFPGRSATFTDCKFRSARLQGAVFRGAYLKWVQGLPEEMEEWVDMDDDPPALLPFYCPPFDKADLKGASFEDVLFEHADFRGARNIGECSFVGAEGLDDCLFDSDEVKEEVLRKAGSTSAKT